MSRPYSLDHLTFVRDLWPGGIGKLQSDTEHDNAVAPLWSKITPSFDAMCAFITVEPVEPPYHDLARRHVVHYLPELEPPTEFFSIKLQGILKDFHIDALGNWNGKENTAFKATRSVVLDSGGCDEPFNIQRDILNCIKEVIIRSVDHTVVDIPIDGRPGIHLRSNVFTQVRNEGRVASVPLPGRDDPRGLAAKIASRWAVTSTMKMHAPGATTGRLLPATRIQFRRGDFVEVEVRPDIVTTYQNRRLRVDVHFLPTSIIRLCTASELKARANMSLTERIPSQLPSTATAQTAVASSSATPQQWQQMIQDSYFPPVPPPSAGDHADGRRSV